MPEDGDADEGDAPRTTTTATTRRSAAAGAAAAAAARRGGRRRALEGTFDHGEEGYGLWLDPAVADNAVYAEHWAGHRPRDVTVEDDRIVIRRAGDEPTSPADDD